MAMLPTMLEEDRKRAGWSVGQAAWRLGVNIRDYRELEAGTRTPSFETWDRICKLYGWPRREPGPLLPRFATKTFTDLARRRPKVRLCFE